MHELMVVQLLSLKATSQIFGDIVAARLAIEPGCRFTGNCDMNAGTVPNDEKQKDKKEEKSVVGAE